LWGLTIVSAREDHKESFPSMRPADAHIGRGVRSPVLLNRISRQKKNLAERFEISHLGREG
jgi:hypothetical protein